MKTRARSIVALCLLLTAVLFQASCTETRPAGVMTIDDVHQSEEVIEGLRAPLAKLTKGLMNLGFPDAQSRSIFEPRVTFTDLASEAATEWTPILDLGVREANWPAAASARSAERDDLVLWSGFLASVDFLHHFNFYNVRGEFDGIEKSSYRTETGFKGLAQLESGNLASVKGRLEILWRAERPDPSREERIWRIAELTSMSFKLTTANRPLFSDVAPHAFDEADRERLLPSLADQNMIEDIVGARNGTFDIEQDLADVRKKSKVEGSNYGLNQVAVVDIDRDGFDDFYYSSFDGRAFFFRNRGDGSFEEIAEELGLALELVHGAFFADLDNDGDADVFITYFNREDGVHYLRNENGRFVERNDLIDTPMRGWTLPISVADYDNDGLLDVFLARYAVPYINGVMARNEAAINEGREPESRFLFMSDEESDELFEHLDRPDSNPIWKFPGPPNLLLKNMGGGRFTRAPNSKSLETYWNTLAAAWSDFDRDGDIDLYVANELGPNALMRNEGDGTFVDVSNEVTGETGWGMGASWGDYDNDGRPDIYITNMFSKAGLRIAGQMDSSADLVKSARGNSLMRNGVDGFTLASGLEPPAALVEAADFAWGGGFGDLTNDGVLDLYVPASMMTIPREVATLGDL